MTQHKTEDDLKFIHRRKTQSFDLDSLRIIISGIKLEKRSLSAPQTKLEKEELVRIDAENITTILEAVDKNYPSKKNEIGIGRYVHAIELAKLIGCFANDHHDPQRDAGTNRVRRLMAIVNKRNLLLRRETLANLPGAGYRIASNKEAIFEVKKGIVSASGRLRAAQTKLLVAVDKRGLKPEEKDIFNSVMTFVDKVLPIFEQEVKQVEDTFKNKDGDEYQIKKTKPGYKEAEEQVFTQPSL